MYKVVSHCIISMQHTPLYVVVIYDLTALPIFFSYLCCYFSEAKSRARSMGWDRTLTSCSSCCYLPHAGIAGRGHRTQLSQIFLRILFPPPLGWRWKNHEGSDFHAAPLLHIPYFCPHPSLTTVFGLPSGRFWLLNSSSFTSQLLLGNFPRFTKSPALGSQNMKYLCSLT